MTNKELDTIWEIFPKDVKNNIETKLYDQFNVTRDHLYSYGAYIAITNVDKAELSRKKELVWEYICNQLSNKG